jgi:hypothetical protein
MKSTMDDIKKNYQKNLNRRTILYGQQIELELKLQEIKMEITKLESDIKKEKSDILDNIEKETDRGKLNICTCEKGLPVDDPNSKYTKCYKHLSRRFENQGCYWCGFRDCSKYGC